MTVVATALAFGAGCGGKHVDERRTPAGQLPREAGAEIDAAGAADARAALASSSGGAGSGGAASTDTRAPDAAKPVSPVPPPPYAYFYANDVDYGKIYGVPRGAVDEAVLAQGGDRVDIGQVFTFDADHVYYSAADATTSVVRTSIDALPVTGRGPAVVLVGGLSQVAALAVDADFLYFLEVAPDDSMTLAKVSLGVASGDAGVERLAEAIGVQGGSIAIYGDYVYWTEQPTLDLFNPVPGSVKRVPRNGGRVEALATSTRPGRIAVDGKGVYWLDVGHPGVDCVPNDGALEYIAVGSDSPVVVASQLAGAFSLVLSDGAAYFATIGPGCNGHTGSVGSIFRASSATGKVELLADKLLSPGDLYIDAEGVYFTEVTDSFNWIMKPAMIPR